MTRFLAKHWFLVGLGVLVPGGIVAGSLGAAGAVSEVLATAGASVATGAAAVPRLTTAVILFLMAFSLDSRHLRDSLSAPQPVLWASLLNYVWLPLLAWPLQWVQLARDFEVGLMIVAAAPCTMAAASVWTRRAGGNDAVSLLVTLVTNGSCFLVAPFWLQLTTGNRVELDTASLVSRLLVAVLVPMVIGQLLRLWPLAAEVATRRKQGIGTLAQTLILVLVLVGAMRAGAALRTPAGNPGLLAVLVVWASGVALHVVTMGCGWTTGRWFGFSREDRVAVALAGSQKTLPIGILLATDPQMFGNPELGVPFAVFPIILYHASQLFVDTYVADRMAASAGAG